MLAVLRAAVGPGCDATGPEGHYLRVSDIPGGCPNGITNGPDGALWFTAGYLVGRITPNGNLPQYRTDHNSWRGPGIPDPHPQQLSDRHRGRARRCAVVYRERWQPNRPHHDYRSDYRVYS